MDLNSPLLAHAGRAHPEVANRILAFFFTLAIVMGLAQIPCGSEQANIHSQKEIKARIPEVGLVAHGVDQPCAQQTGGTCFLTKCDVEFRGSSVTCAVSNWSELWWHGCRCSGASPCAGFDGKCHKEADLSMGSSSWARYEFWWLFIPFLITVGRAGLQSSLTDWLGLNRAMRFVEHKHTFFAFDKSFQHLSEEQEFPTDKCHQLYVAAGSKFLGLHQGQIVFCWFTFWAYSGFMGPFQRFFAIGALFKETWYGILTWWALFQRRNFLMMVPFSEKSKELVLMYVLNPDYFVSSCIMKTSEFVGLNKFTYIVSILGANAALVALLIGLVGQGAMFPSLFGSYTLVAMSAYIVFVVGKQVRALFQDIGSSVFDCIATLQWSGSALQYVPEDRRTESLCMKALKREGIAALEFVPEDRKTDALCVEAVKQDWGALPYVPAHRRKDALCMEAVKQSWVALQYVPEERRTDALCMESMKQNSRALQYVPEDKKTESLLMEALNRFGLALQYVPEDRRTDALCMEAVKQDWEALQYVPFNMCLKPEALCMEAMKQNLCAFQYVPEYRRTESLCMLAVKRDGTALQYVPEAEKTDALCMEAVKQNWVALQYMPEYFRTQALCVEAVKQNWVALQYMPEDRRTDALCMEALKQSGRALRYVPEDRKTEALCIEAVKQIGSALQYVPKNMKTEALCMEAVKQTGSALKFVPKDRRTTGLCMEAVKESASALRYVPDDRRTEVERDALNQYG